MVVLITPCFGAKISQPETIFCSVFTSFFSGDHILKLKSEAGKPLLNFFFEIFNLLIKVAFPRVFEIEKTERSGLESHFVE